MRIGLALKFVLFLFGVFLCATAGSIYYMNDVFVRNYIEQKEKESAYLAKTLDDTIEDISYEAFDASLMRDIDLLSSHAGVRIIICDVNGKIFFDSRRVRVNNFLDREKELLISDESPVAKFQLKILSELDMKLFPASKATRYADRMEDVSLVYFAPVHHQRKIVGQLIIEDKASSIEQYLKKIRDRITIFMSFLFLTFSLLAYVIVSVRLVRPMHQIETLARKVAENDFSERLDIRTNDETSRLARVFNTMVYNLEKKTSELQEKNEGLVHFANELEMRNEEMNRRQKLIDFDLRLAHNVQQELLPQVYPRIDNLVISAANFQVGEIGGDCFDFYKLNDKKIAAFIGDVSGKGIAAALVMSMVTILFSQLQDDMVNPAKVLGKVNDIMYRHFGSRHSIYMTCFFLTLDAETMTLTFSCAGHNPPFVYRKETDEIISLESEGFGLGMFSKVIYQEKQVKVKPGDKIILYTDGVVDSRNKDGDMFGLDNLKKTIRNNKSSNSFRLTHMVVEELELFAGGAHRHDDLTLIVVEIQDIPDSGNGVA